MILHLKASGVDPLEVHNVVPNATFRDAKYQNIKILVTPTVSEASTTPCDLEETRAFHTLSEVSSVYSVLVTKQVAVRSPTRQFFLRTCCQSQFPNGAMEYWREPVATQGAETDTRELLSCHSQARWRHDQWKNYGNRHGNGAATKREQARGTLRRRRPRRRVSEWLVLLVIRQSSASSAQRYPSRPSPLHEAQHCLRSHGLCHAHGSGRC